MKIQHQPNYKQVKWRGCTFSQVPANADALCINHDGEVIAFCGITEEGLPRPVRTGLGGWWSHALADKEYVAIVDLEGADWTKMILDLRNG